MDADDLVDPLPPLAGEEEVEHEVWTQDGPMQNAQDSAHLLRGEHISIFISAQNLHTPGLSPCPTVIPFGQKMKAERRIFIPLSFYRVLPLLH